MNLKIFRVDYSHGSQAPEASIILAETKERALNIAINYYNDIDDSLKLNVVDNIKKVKENEDDDIINYYIEEIKLEKETMIYTGHYCC